MIEAYDGKKGRVISALYQALLESRGNSTWLEEHNQILHNPKDEREVCPGTERMLEVMWRGGDRPHTHFF